MELAETMFEGVDKLIGGDFDVVELIGVVDTVKTCRWSWWEVSWLPEMRMCLRR